MEQHELVSEIKIIRVDLDKHFSTMGKMKGSREISVAITATQNSKMWLGQVLKSLEQENPYPDSKNPTNNNIAATSDVFDGDVDSAMDGIHHIKQVKIMRQRLSHSYDAMEKLEEEHDVSDIMTTKGFHSLTKAWEYVVEANMWFGMELGRINKESKE